MEATMLMKLSERELELISMGLSMLQGESDDIDNISRRINNKLAFMEAKILVEKGDPDE